MVSKFFKLIGVLYYTITTATIITFLHFFIRLSRRPSPKSLSSTKVLNKGLITIYSIVNLFIFYYFFLNKIHGYLLYIINESITIGISYILLSGFYVYGITGQICSGKSSACGYLHRRYGATIISLDDINREILTKPNVIESIRKAFGESVIKHENLRPVINKSVLKKIIFEDKTKRRKLESITHPKIMLEFFRILFVERFFNLKKFIFIENAILLRFNLFKILVKSVVSICVSNKKILIDRIMNRDNNSNNKVDEETANNILKNQMPLEEFKKKSDIVVYNDEGYQNLELKLDKVMEEIIRGNQNNKIFIN